MQVPARISLITLGVADLAVSTAFYEALGWLRSSASTPEISFFGTATAVLGLFPFDKLAEDARVTAGEKPVFGGVTLAINVESEAEVDRVLGEARAAGARILKPAERAFWGGYSGYFADPDGYPWEVAYNPFLPLVDGGKLELPD